MKTAFSMLLGIALGLSVLASGPGYRVAGKIPLGGEGWWDYLTVDSQAHRLYVSRGTHVAVVDLKSGKQVADIPDTEGVHGVALAPALGRGFISCGRANQSVIFDLKSDKVLGKVPTGENPDAILFDPATKRVFTFNGRSKDATVIDAATGKVVATLPLGGKPEEAAADGKGKIYANIEDTSEVVEIDSAKPAVLRRFSLRPGEEPSGLAFDVKHGLVFSGCSNKLMTVLDVKSGKVIATVPIGEGVDGCGFDPATGLAFSSNGEGTLTVVRQATSGRFEVAETVPTQRGARTMALDPQTHAIYLSTAEFGPRPKPTPDNPHGRPPVLKDSFTILVVKR